MNTHLKAILGFRGFFDIDFLFIVEIWHDIQKGSGYTLNEISCQIVVASPSSSYLLYRCHNIWCNSSKETLFLRFFFLIFNFPSCFTINACFWCALCGNATVLCPLSLKKTVQNPLWKIQLCPKLINVMMENNQLRNSDANSTLYSAAMKGLPLSSHIFIWTSPVCFTLTKFPYATSIYLFVSASETSIK